MNIQDNIFFPVTQVPLSSLTGMEDGNQQAIVRTDTNRILAVHGASYKLAKNEDVYGQVDEMLRKQTVLDINGMQVRDQTAYAGGRTIRTYAFPEHRISVGHGDETILKINVINSYDGSTGLRLCAGGYRMICSNGQVIGEQLADYRNRHTSGYFTKNIPARLANSILSFTQAGDQWNEWRTTYITDFQAEECLKRIAGESKMLLVNLMQMWQIETRHLGKTKWALFNTMTQWATHYKVNEKSIPNKPAIVLQREEKVTTVLRSDGFKSFK